LTSPTTRPGAEERRTCLIEQLGYKIAGIPTARVIAAADRVSLATGQLLSQLDPVLFDKIKESWLRSSQPI